MTVVVESILLDEVSFLSRSSSIIIVIRFPIMKIAFHSFIPSVFFQILKKLVLKTFFNFLSH